MVEAIAREIQGEIPEEINIETVSVKYPVAYEQSMNTVLVQEIVRLGLETGLGLTLGLVLGLKLG